MQYWEFSNPKPPMFNGVKYPIVSMMWISNVEGCFYTCSCPKNPKVRFALNLLLLGMKDWWKFTTHKFSTAERVVVTWEHLSEMFQTEYLPLVKREVGSGVSVAQADDRLGYGDPRDVL